MGCLAASPLSLAPNNGVGGQLVRSWQSSTSLRYQRLQDGVADNIEEKWLASGQCTFTSCAFIRVEAVHAKSLAQVSWEGRNNVANTACARLKSH